MDWLLRVLAAAEREIRVCCINCALYCYVQHENFGQTRDPKKSYTQDGFPRVIEAYSKIRDMPQLQDRTRKLITRSIYRVALNSLWRRPVKPSAEVYAVLRDYLRKYSRDYYFSKSLSFWEKPKSLVKYLLILLHIHKP